MSINTLFDLSGRIAFVSGAAGHLGASMAEALAEAGAKVILNGRNISRLEKFAEFLSGKGLDVCVEGFDINDESEVRRRFDSIQKQWKKLDIVVNNAYSGAAGTIASSTAAHFRNAYEIGVVSAFSVIQAALPCLSAAAAERGGASIINIASMYGSVSPDPRVYGISGMNNPPFYGATKGGLIQLTRYMACHLAPTGIRCNSISPGPFPPEGISAEFSEELVRRVPMARLGHPKDLKGIVVFLASDSASYVTGANIPVDGGWTAW